jgi:hypothetical protein
MTQALYAHMNNKTVKKKDLFSYKEERNSVFCSKMDGTGGHGAN